MLVGACAGSVTSGATSWMAGRAAARAVVVGQPLDVVVERVQAGRGEDADLAHAGAVALAPDPGLGDPLGRGDQHRADRRAESLGQADRHGVEAAAELAQRRRRWRRGRSTAGRRRGAGRARARRRQLAAPRELRRAAGPCRRRSCGCSRPRSPRSRPGTGRRRARSAPRHGVDVEPAARRRPGADGDAGERRGGAELGPRRCGRSASQSISWPGGTSSRRPSWLRQRAGRHEQAGLVAEQLGDLGLERVDRRVLAVDVVADLGARPSPRRIAARRPGDGVGAQVDRRRLGRRRRSDASATQPLGDPERQLQRLLGVQPRVAGRLVARGRGRRRRSARRRRGTR